MKYRHTTATARGTRQYNQDRAACLEGESSVLLVLGDGLGGHAGGDIAAEILVDTASRAFLQLRTPLVDEPSLFLALILQHAHRAINAYRKNSTADIDPRTTAVLCLVQDGYAYWAHAGDSRLYLFRNGSQLTRTLDHTGRDQARAIPGGKPSTGGLFNCIGGPQRPHITLGPEIALQLGDRILLCSDGVWQGMATDEIAEYLHRDDLEDACIDMLETIENRHSERCDNATVLVLEWQDRSAPGKSASHEEIRDLADDDLWRAAREAEQRVAMKSRIEQSVKRHQQATTQGGELDELESFLSEVESIVSRWEPGD